MKNERIEVSVIISVYKNSSNLKLILNALEKQVFKNFEVIVAEDNDASEMKEFVKSCQGRFSFPLQHVFQEDIGFRKCRALNQAIRASNGQLLVFLDGDCIPHRQLIAEYVKSAGSRMALVGRRVMLNEKLTQKLVTSESNLNFWTALMHSSKRIEEGIYCSSLNRFVRHNRGIWGCNWAVLKSEIEAINGFDEDYVKAGIGEDTDIEWRLRQNGVRLHSMKFKAIVYHLHHTENYTSTTENEEQFKAKKQLKKIYCENGLSKH